MPRSGGSRRPSHARLPGGVPGGRSPGLWAFTPGSGVVALAAVGTVLAMVVGGLLAERGALSDTTDPVAGTSAGPTGVVASGSASPGAGAPTPGVPSTTAAGRPVTTTTPAATSSRPAGRANPGIGVYRGTSVARVREYERWLGRRVGYVVDYSARDTWDEIADPGYMLDEWQGTRYTMVFSVPMFPASGGSYEAGVSGEYDRHFRRLARNLVAYGHEDAVIRLGWEFNLPTSRWSTSDPSLFIAYWRRVVTTMREVEGQDFLFDWNVNIGDTKYDATLYWPGDAWVDLVGVDAYDVSWQPDTYPYPRSCAAVCRLDRQQSAWAVLLGGARGLEFWSGFARAKGKPLTLPEWGLWNRPDGHGGGDNPYFIRQMHAFITDPANRVAYHAYFENDGDDGEHRLSVGFTAAGEVFRELFGTR